MTAEEEDLIRAFRQAMGSMASSVCVLSTQIDGEWFGMTMTAVTSYSMAPPSALFCINQTASMHDLLARRPRKICLNFLAEGQAAISDAFSSAENRNSRFEFGVWEETISGVPILKGAQSNILCSTRIVRTVFTHSIFLAVVEEVSQNDCQKSLVYVNHRYSSPY